LKDKLSKIDSEFLYADGYDDCIIGLTFREDKLVVLYDADGIVDKLSKDMPHEEARDFFDFNINGAYVGERTPMFWSREFLCNTWEVGNDT
jgi:hypothetical protein